MSSQSSTSLSRSNLLNSVEYCLNKSSDYTEVFEGEPYYPVPNILITRFTVRTTGDQDWHQEGDFGHEPRGR